MRGCFFPFLFWFFRFIDYFCTVKTKGTMRKFLLFALLMVGMTAGAQEKNDTISNIEVIDLNRTFSVGGSAILCLRSNEASKKDLKSLNWTLKNDRIGETNLVVLEVKNSRDGSNVAYQTWSDVQVRMKTKDKKPILYEVYDDTFSHLRIANVDMGYIILFFSQLLK